MELITMENLPHCIKCGSEFTYEDGNMYVCPECAHEWAKDSGSSVAAPLEVRDAHGHLLKDGDSVTIIKDLKVKGAPSALKIGVKVKDIRLVEPENGHNITAKIKGFGQMMLKSEFVKKSL